MAVEAKRGCGFRKVGGLYLVSGGTMEPCDRLPVALEVCPCCGAGIKYSRGWTWIDPEKLLGGDHGDDCRCNPRACPICAPSYYIENKRTGLLWIGEKFYPTTADFMREGAAQGISRRISTLPRGFMVGETWVFLAHIRAGFARENGGFTFSPGIFSAFKPSRIERIVKQSEFDHHEELYEEYKSSEQCSLSDCVPKSDEVFWRLHRDYERDITLVPVPDDDPDHNPEANGGEDD